MALGPPKQQALLATLLLRLDMPTGPDQLIGALWGHEAPAYAKNLVQKYVSGLRGALAAAGPGACGQAPRLLWEGGGYRLDIDKERIDLYVYEQLAATGTTLALTGSLHKAAQHLDSARILVTGPLAEGLDAPILERERVYRDERFLADMELRAELELDLGRHRNAIPYLYFMLHKHPLSERFSWLLMLALFRADRGAEALAVYDEYRRRVVTELGTDPGRALRRLHHQILDQDPKLMVVRAVPAQGGARRPEPEPATVRELEWEPDVMSRQLCE
ncbi:BTAD domain-containing putative transcriptional regulator [Streptomyces sp. VRA16 Mangrove soil]|uniref:AfsR/SARP family transcriptional regulator n=1 Tax=Streptomyces sp. VRA16 Mangrove soil TaxID=2817434 RepID=UPI001A9D528E|nr:BTAD domain-containing putative transcriptional regulator [Streptomyces sp. VRA16 Mangrove soil]MBO1334255.1 AfsR/SARP family transcriptional regulator [Streptomyces sp. VRA16 Mangrove soil]